MNKLGERIFALRTGRNMSQGDLADALNVSRQAVSKWENGMGTPTPENIVAMSTLFGVSTDYILMGETAKNEPAPPETVCTAPAPASEGLGKRKIMQIIGIILISLGAVFSLVGLILAVELLLFTVYMIIAGIILLACGKHLGFALAWATVAYAFCLNFFFTGGFSFLSFTFAGIFSSVSVLALVGMVIFTVIYVKKIKNKA